MATKISSRPHSPVVCRPPPLDDRVDSASWPAVSTSEVTQTTSSRPRSAPAAELCSTAAVNQTGRMPARSGSAPTAQRIARREGTGGEGGGRTGDDTLVPCVLHEPPLTPLHPLPPILPSGDFPPATTRCCHAPCAMRGTGSPSLAQRQWAGRGQGCVFHDSAHVHCSFVRSTYSFLSCLLGPRAFLAVLPSALALPRSRIRFSSSSGPRATPLCTPPPLQQGRVRKVPKALHLNLHARAGSFSAPGCSPSCQAPRLGRSSLQQTLSLLKPAGSRMSGDHASVPIPRMPKRPLSPQISP